MNGEKAVRGNGGSDGRKGLSEGKRVSEGL